jgi:hypothetical protein
MSSFDPIAHLKEFARGAANLLSSDLKAISAAQQDACPGGSARPALDVVAECAMVNGRVAHFILHGEAPPRPSSEEREALLASYDSQQKALAFLEGETAKLVGALDGLDAARLGETTDEIFFGRPMTLFQIAEMPAVHMMYHDGQLNYIQALHGDTEMHWG